MPTPDQIEKLLEAVRVRVTPGVLRDLRDTAEAMRAMAAGKAERAEAEGLFLLLEMHDKITEAFK